MSSKIRVLVPWHLAACVAGRWLAAACTCLPLTSTDMLLLLMPQMGVHDGELFELEAAVLAQRAALGLSTQRAGASDGAACLALSFSSGIISVASMPCLCCVLLRVLLQVMRQVRLCILLRSFQRMTGRGLWSQWLRVLASCRLLLHHHQCSHEHAQQLRLPIVWCTLTVAPYVGYTDEDSWSQISHVISLVAS